jgi:hypothetical protein
MAKLTLKDWLYAQHVPPEVMADIEKLFALPEKWQSECDRISGHSEECCWDRHGEELRRVLGIEQSKR